MTRYRAVTESGADYVIDFDERWWTKRGSRRYFLHSFRTPDRHGEGSYIGWPVVKAAPEADAPVVGKSIFVTSGRVEEMWLSTDVVSVEVLDE